MPPRRRRISLAEADLHRRTLRLGESELDLLRRTSPVIERSLVDLCGPTRWASDGALRATLGEPSPKVLSTVCAVISTTARAWFDDTWLDASQELADAVCEAARGRGQRVGRDMVLRDLGAFLAGLKVALARDGWAEPDLAAANSAWIKAGLLHVVLWMPDVTADDAPAIEP